MIEGPRNWIKLDIGADSQNPSRPEKRCLTHSRNLGVHDCTQHTVRPFSLNQWVPWHLLHPCKRRPLFSVPFQWRRNIYGPSGLVRTKLLENHIKNTFGDSRFYSIVLISPDQVLKFGLSLKTFLRHCIFNFLICLHGLDSLMDGQRQFLISGVEIVIQVGQI